MNKIYNIQALRGIAALLVVLSHLLIIEQKYGGTQTILSEMVRFGVFGVDLFFVISGFIMITISRNKFQSSKETLKFIYHRTTRIYPAYWFYSSLLLIVFLIYPEWVNSSQGNKVDILRSFLLIPSDTLPLLAVGWTLIHEVYFYIVFSIILLTVKEKYVIHAVVLWGAGVALFSVFLESDSPIVNLVISPLTIEFIAGCILAKVDQNSTLKLKNITLIMLILLTLVVSIYFFMEHEKLHNSTPEGWLRPLILGLPALLITYFLLLMERNKAVFNSLLVRLGDGSYSIYLTHILTFSVVGKLWHMFYTDEVYDNLAMVPIVFVLACLVGMLGYTLVEKPMLGLSRKILKQ